MSGSVDAIIAEAVQLPPDQRLALARRILRSVEPEPSPDLDAAWDAEIRDRIARYDAGGTKSVPASEVFAEVVTEASGADICWGQGEPLRK